METCSAKSDIACALYATRACAILNMRACEDCPVHRAKKGEEGDRANTVADYLDRFEALLPEEGIAQLFESETCTLCKTEPKGKASAFAIIDFGHSEPKELHYRRLFTKGDVGFMVPLQFACCRNCRSRLLLASYLPLLMPILLTALVVPFVADPHLCEALRRVASYLPALLVGFGLIGGYALGKVLQAAARKPFSRAMYFDLLTHPVAQRMIALGWFPLFGEKHPQPVFSKKRLYYGLGNAPSEVYSGKKPENGENPD